MDANAGTFEVGQGALADFQGQGKLNRLTASELATYKADRQYVRSLARPGSTIAFNHADPRQHRFVVLRLKLAGKTAENSPELFKRIAELRSRHEAMRLESGTTYAEPGTDIWTNQHFIPSVNVVSATTMEAVATASRKDATYYGYVDSMTWAADGTPLGEMAYAEVYGDMKATSITASGNPELTSLSDFEGDSFLAEDTVEFGYRESYSFNTVTNRIKYDPIAVGAPIDTKLNDKLISVCLNRTWTQDCDYDLTGTPTALKVPLQGSVTISKDSFDQGYRFDPNKIDQYQRGAATDSLNRPDPGGSIRVTLTKLGGGCNATTNDPNLVLSMQTFWQNVLVSPDLKTLSWNLTGATAALFDESCRQVQDAVYLTMNVNLPWTRGMAKGPSSIYLTNVEHGARPDYRFDTIKITNSCLAAGTKIELADGSSVAIEDIEAGAQVFNTYASTSTLTVTDTAKGYELTPMVRIVDEAGRSLLMTEMHPIHVAGRGMVLAKSLRMGDQVMTREGPSKLVRVTRERYDGNVYNLKVGTEAEALKLGKDETVVYANGFLVGDGQIQSKYESLEQSARQVANRTRLPQRWRQDYLGSARRTTSL